MYIKYIYIHVFYYEPLFYAILVAGKTPILYSCTKCIRMHTTQGAPLGEEKWMRPVDRLEKIWCDKVKQGGGNINIFSVCRYTMWL